MLTLKDVQWCQRMIERQRRRQLKRHVLCAIDAKLRRIVVRQADTLYGVVQSIKN